MGKKGKGATRVRAIVAAGVEDNAVRPRHSHSFAYLLLAYIASTHHYPAILSPMPPPVSPHATFLTRHARRRTPTPRRAQS